MPELSQIISRHSWKQHESQSIQNMQIWYDQILPAFQEKLIEILHMQQPKNQNSMTFAPVKLPRRMMPFYVYTGASAQWENGQNKGK